MRGKLVRALLADSDCDILCVTEGGAEILPDGGDLIDAGSDWGAVPSRKAGKTVGKCSSGASGDGPPLALARNGR